MSVSRRPGSTQHDPFSEFHPARTTGSLGMKDAGDPTVLAERGDTEGALGMIGDHASLLANAGPGIPSGTVAHSPTQGRRPKKQGPKPAAPISIDVLNVVGVFRATRKWSDEEIKNAIEAGTGDWYPGTEEMRQFANTGPGKVEFVSSVDDFAKKILELRPHRINLFTHGVPRTIMLTGLVSTGNVESSGYERGDLDPSVMKEMAEIDDVRAALPKGAELAIYACHSGADPKLLQSLASVLGITVRGSSKDIRYWPIWGRAFDKVKRFTAWEYSVGDNQKVSDFRGLYLEITATPEDKETGPKK